ncbi:MAG: hypothetical protein WHT08_17690 [Bryobacteraceae bacterium]
MRLISLRKYLEQAGGARGGSCSMPCLAFAGALLSEDGPGGGVEGVDAEAFERDPGVREQVFERALESLQKWKAEQEAREAEARVEMQRLLAAFNRAVMALADGGEKAAGRFALIRQTLERASRADSLPAMRAAVYEAAEQLKRESEAQQAETAAQMEALGRRLEEARHQRAAEGSRGTEARGREAAIRALREAEARGWKAAVAGVVFDRWGALVSRFGREVAEEALAAFEGERIAELALDGRVYAWAPQMRVWLADASGDAEAVRERLEAALGEPFEYRTVAAGRVVTLALEGRWMWGLLGRTKGEALIEEVDLFAAGTPIRR